MALAVAALSGGLAVAAAGCDQTDPEAAALAEAVSRLDAAYAGGAAPVSGSYRNEQYQAARDKSKQADGESVSPAARALVEARASLGLAQVELERTITLERQVSDLASRVRAEHALSMSQRALAGALSDMAGAIEFAPLEEELRALEEEQGRAGGTLSEREDAVRALREEMDGLLERAKAVRQREAEKRAEALDAPASRRAALLQEAVRVQREADALEMDAARLEARIGVEAPLAEETARELEGARTRADLVRAALDAAQERRGSLESGAADANASAETAREEAASAVEAFMSIRSGALATAYTEADGLYNAAITGRAAGADRASLALTQGSAHTQRAEMHERRAARAGALIAQLAAAEMGAAALEALREERAGATAAATQALESAIETYNSALGSLRGEARDNAEEVVTALRGRLDSLRDAAP